MREDQRRVFQGGTRTRLGSRIGSNVCVAHPTKLEIDLCSLRVGQFEAWRYCIDCVFRVTKMLSKGLILVMLMVGLVKAEVVICTKEECMTEFGRRLKCYGVNAGEKTLFIQSFRGGDGRFYGFRQIALSNLFLSDDDDDAQGGNSGPNEAIFGTVAPSNTIPDLSREVDRQQQQQRAQGFSFPGFGGPICVLEEVPQVLGTGGVAAFGNPFGLCCRACRR